MNISPDDFLLKCVGLVNANSAAYPDWSEHQLRSHFVAQMLKHSMQVRLTDGEVTALCTFDIQPEQKTIHLIGLIGDRNFILFMRDRWKAEYPDYVVTMERRNKFRQFAKV